MKTRLSLAIMMISTFAWAMPSAKYIPADAAAVITVCAPHESTFVKELNALVAQNKDSFYFLKAMFTFDLYILRSYDVSPEMQGDFVMIDILGEENMNVIFLEGTFDVDIVLTKIRQSPDALGKLFDKKRIVCGKMPGGLYICSEPIEERVKALLAGKGDPISPTSAFAKLVNEKNDPNRFAIRFLGKGGKGGLKQLREDFDLSAAKVSLIERMPGVAGIDATLYAKDIAPITRIHTQMQGMKMVLPSLAMGIPSLAQFVNQIKIKVDAARKRLTLSGSVAVKDFEMLQETWSDFIDPRQLIDDASLITSPTFKIENVEDFVSDWNPPNLNQSKTFTIEGHRVTVTAQNMSLHASKGIYRSYSMSIGDDYAQLDGDAKAGIFWNVSSPTNVEIKEMYVTQGDKTFEFRPVDPPIIAREEGAQRVSGQMIGRPTGDVDISFGYRIIPLIQTSSAFQVGKLEDFFNNKDGKTITIEGRNVTVSAKKTSRGGKTKTLDVMWKLTFPNDLEIIDLDVVPKDEEYGDYTSYSGYLRSYDGMRRMTFTTSGRPTGDVGIEFQYRNWTDYEK